MLRAISALVLFSISTFAVGQDYKSEFRKLCGDGKISEALPLITKWEGAKPDDPEMFIAYFNYYFNLSRKELVRMGNDPGGGQHLTIKEAIEPDL